MHTSQTAPRQNQAAIRETCERSDGALDLPGVEEIDWTYLNAERRCHGLDHSKLPNSRRYCSISKNRCSLQAGRSLSEQFGPFPSQTVCELHKAGGIGAWSSQALNEAGTDRSGDIDEHDWQSARGQK